MTEEELIVDNVRLAYWVARGYTNVIEYEEACSIASLGLVKAAKSFDVDKNVKFSTYAIRVMHNEIKMAIRYFNKHSRRYGGSLDAAMFDTDDSNAVDFHVIIPADCSIEKDAEDAVLTNFIYSYILALPKKIQWVLLSYFEFIPKLTQCQLATITGYSQSYISRLYKKHCTIIYSLYTTGSSNYSKEDILSGSKV